MYALLSWNYSWISLIQTPWNIHVQGVLISEVFWFQGLYIYTCTNRVFARQPKLMCPFSWNVLISGCPDWRGSTISPVTTSSYTQHRSTTHTRVHASIFFAVYSCTHNMTSNHDEMEGHLPHGGCGAIFVLVVFFQAFLRLLGPNAFHVQLPLLLCTHAHAVHNKRIIWQTSCDETTSLN